MAATYILFQSKTFINYLLPLHLLPTVPSITLRVKYMRRWSSDQSGIHCLHSTHTWTVTSIPSFMPSSAWSCLPPPHY